MELLQPQPLSSIGMMTLHIVDHSSTKEFDVSISVFETILSLKQIISLKYGINDAYLPMFLFLAIKDESSGLYKPIEFQYINLKKGVIPKVQSVIQFKNQFFKEYFNSLNSNILKQK